MERDGHKCRMCGRDWGLADVHHIIKRSQGGTDDMNNPDSALPRLPQQAAS